MVSWFTALGDVYKFYQPTLLYPAMEFSMPTNSPVVLLLPTRPSCLLHQTKPFQMNSFFFAICTTKKESEWFSIETSPTWYAILKYARTMINKLRRLDGRGHFKALFTSFSRRALHKDIGTCSNFKAKYWSFPLLYHDSLWPKNVMLESLMQI